MKPGMILHLQKVAGISGSEAHLLSLLPHLRERGWDIRMLMLHENEPGAWDFADAPLVMRAFLGGQLNEDGVQFRWLAPTDTYWDVGAELGRGRAFPASLSASGNG